MATKTETYVDTSAFIAFLDRSDTYHSLFRRLFADPPPLITTPLVIAEGHDWFLKRYDRTRALQFMAMVEVLSPLQVIDVGLQEQRGAAELLRNFSVQDLTLADAMGLHVMDHRSIQTCWSTDFHLGLTRVPLIIYQY
ncbi:PIN domain-containing protein [Acaryochloris sp. IP29b_bin.137]|uniref:type II toxin-antitoxin system VapC family toxin n=1 Tax=Acaryochloris sp. IP29b_bin.137 TaxID=2969217 RepID=UPI002634B186|nr:PIN domain-containing protein [Acaryochloris sp. IP29b_bin.137]